MNIYITSDTHAYHKNAIKWDKRKRFNTQTHLVDSEYDRKVFYQDTLSMNEEIISNWNSVIKKNDLVYHLGDVSFAKPSTTREFLERLNGNIFLIVGNHDKMKDIRKYSDLLVGVEYYKEIKHQYENKNYHIVMMHYPIESWNRKHYGSIHCFGHTHGKLKKDNRSIDVGLDTEFANFKPILLNDIINELKDVEIY